MDKLAATLTDWICKRNEHNQWRGTDQREKLRGRSEDEGEGECGNSPEGRMLWQLGLWEFGEGVEINLTNQGGRVWLKGWGGVWSFAILI